MIYQGFSGFMKNVTLSQTWKTLLASQACMRQEMLVCVNLLVLQKCIY